MPREFNRSDRVAAQIQREIADLLRIEVKDAELGMVTLSDVELSRDLAVAKLYVSFLGGQIPANQCIKKLNARVPELRHELGKRIRIRVLPELRFVYDDSIERGMRMDSLLQGLTHEGSETDGDPQPE
ncbi:MAG: 30S ribosome-binding factor RbfA [Methylococcus sp.]|nr:MAG: 30S ribosome-binding factor RbfA [Methylococcus sp.]